MKKVITLLCASMIAVSLTACGGSSKEVTSSTEAAATTAAETTQETTQETTEAPTTEPETTLSAYDENKNAILEYIDLAYTGLTPAGAPMHFMTGNGGEYVALVMENANGESYISFIGSAELDESSGIITIKDSDTGYTFGFTAEQQSDGSFYLDCGNLGAASLVGDEPGDVVDNILNVFDTMDDFTDEFMDAVARLDFMESLDIALTGVTAAGGPMFFLASNDGEFAALVMVGASGTGYMSFVGKGTVDEASGILTVTDDETGYSFGFTVEQQEDGSYYLDCGDFGVCYMEEDEISNVVDYIDTVYLELEDITETVVNEVTN